MKKKIFCLLFVLLIFPLNVYADKREVKVVCDKTKIYVNDTLNCSIVGKSDYKVELFKSNIKLDSSFELVDITPSSMWGISNIMDNELALIGVKEKFTINKDFIIANFSVKWLNAGNFTLVVEDIVFDDIDEFNNNTVSIDSISTKIQVLSESSDASSGGSNSGTSTESNNNDKSTKYNVIFDSNGGELSGNENASCIVKTGSSCVIDNLPIVTRDGYKFTGWNITEDCTSGDDVSINLTSDNEIYYACWIKSESDLDDNDLDNNIGDNNDIVSKDKDSNSFKFGSIVLSSIILISSICYLIYYKNKKK